MLTAPERGGYGFSPPKDQHEAGEQEHEMTASALITGRMESLRRPLVRNIKRGAHALVLTDTNSAAVTSAPISCRRLITARLAANIDVGGTGRSKIHLDGVILDPTLYVGGHRRIQDGDFVRPIEGEVATKGA